MPPPKFNPVRDTISGLIMAATSVPQLVAYAETAGYASYRGLSTAGPSLIAWGLVSGHPIMNSGVTSITALMAKTDLDGEDYVAHYGEEQYVYLISAYSMVVGLCSVLLAVVGFGKLAQSCPKTVRSGFKWGCSVGVLGSALPNGLIGSGAKELKTLVAQSAIAGLQSTVKASAPAATGFIGVTNTLYALSNPQVWTPVCATLFLSCTAFVMKAHTFLPKWLPPGTEVILATAAATLFSIYTNYEYGMVGAIPTMNADQGLSLFGGTVTVPIEILSPHRLLESVTSALPLRFGGYPQLLLSATLFAAVNFLSIMGIASGFEADNNIKWSAPRELSAQGVACVVAGLTGSAPVSGSMSRSLVSRMTGTTSQLACIVTALVWIYALPYMSIMSPTPKAALSAVVVSAVVKGVIYPKDLLHMKKGTDQFVGWGTAIVTALTSPTIGFGIGLVFFGVAEMMVPGWKKANNATKAKRA